MTNTATASSYPQLPIIDLSAADRGPEARALLHAQLHSAAHDVGFFQLVGHGVGEDEIARLTGAMREFFALPEAERLALDNVNSPHFRGYTRTGDERTGGSRDWRDQLDIGAERAARVPGDGEPAYWWLQGPNQWPGSLPGLRDAALAWIDRLSAVAQRLLRELLVSIGAPADFYDPIFGERAHPHLKLVRYPGSAGDGADQGVGAHKDYGFLTLLLQDQVGGLQVERADGLFHDVPPIPGAFVVNLGELLEVATNGYLLATHHRVVSPAGATERFSVPFFYNPRLDARVEPLVFPYASVAPGVTDDPGNPLFAEYGFNELKGKLRAHPLVAERHHAGLLSPA
ncbi:MULTISPECIES: isopenicillin N synthase family dioxygenase [Streptomyces]|uniref:isopenicillin N synthase family dioxygenase n=1 Tax=Streptomyces TaxID=1883 RepID=UPI000BD6D6BA|nr:MULTISPECIES: 2-oxoglutarate and iron-dependent oxygenase domain-containing protein [Streptomyces]MDX2552211.1 2-oxoglutarate and iron-dependent oxygenase domain-containing protein [Streptomyces stelliscabiei]MDX2609421.1 2-oxoglutarate and iron-dependent oxygenase domain-containing protein [Streptomyces stelliscabiei]MDX2636624.1 2-oxoglutarate and iron-dependent oxygenase domain-containing protein [Streptomyces stelliscabiei]MDX2660056.1 2-oxoglutarate and iron-dependent oxygenase domain-c